MKISNQNIHKLLLFILCTFLTGACIYRVYENDLIEYSKECLSKIESVNVGMQRLSKLELENNPNDELIKEINYIVCYELFLNNDINTPGYFQNNDEMMLILKDIFVGWKNFYSGILNFRENDTRSEFFKASEEEYVKMSAYSENLQTKIDEYTKKVMFINLYILINLVAIALIFIKFLSSIISELKKNKELSKDMFIDTSTGLYNSSKCHEILKSTSTEPNQAIVVCDLNGLKNTNDDFGHRAGDQLIYCFATELKKATNIFQNEVFVGRYGGDEFLVSIDNVEELDVKTYINEINFLMEQFNEIQNKPFKLSCAIGYAISTEHTNKLLTKKELFDIADGNMYKNKIEMKKAR